MNLSRLEDVLQKQLEFFLESATFFFFRLPLPLCALHKSVLIPKTTFKSNLMRNFAQNSLQLNWYVEWILVLIPRSYQINLAQNIFSNEKTNKVHSVYEVKRCIEKI